MTASLAASKTGARRLAHQSVVRCGTLYTPPCTPPVVGVHSIVACQQTGKTLKFPISVHANAGLLKASVRFRGKTIKSKTFPGNPTSAHFTAKISTRGFAPGLFTLTASVTDVNDKTAKKSAHFTICKPTPVFTG